MKNLIINMVLPAYRKYIRPLIHDFLNARIKQSKKSDERYYYYYYVKVIDKNGKLKVGNGTFNIEKENLNIFNQLLINHIGVKYIGMKSFVIRGLWKL